jgi:glutaryl-CoA dehydrogenase
LSKFEGVDYYDTSALLSSEERLVRDSIREWVETEFLPLIQSHHREGTFPLGLVPKLANLGVFGSTIPNEVITPLGDVAYGLVMQELERGDSALRSFVSVQSSLVMYPIYRYGSAQQRDLWLEPLRQGKAIGCFGLTEADHGSDPSGMKTHARKVGDQYVLNGSKYWITNGSIADIAVVWAKGEDEQIYGFLVEKGTPGFVASEIKGKFSLRASVTSELSFRDCVIPAKNKLPDAAGLRAPLACLSQARYGIAWGVIGAAMDCYEVALRYAKERVQFGKPIAARQLVQRKLVWMLQEITKAQLLALQLGRLKEKGSLRPGQVSLAKMNNAWMALEVARQARDILGAAGIVDDYPVIRHLLNLETVVTYEGTHDIHTLAVGRDITGLSAFD